MEIRGQIADIANRRIYSGTVVVEQGRILEIREEAHNEPGFIMPGFVDAHIHIESSMLVPSEFARKAVLHGTLGTISDPHEIANVLGVDGVRFMIENGKKTPFKFHFGAPSCVPATSFETAGAVIDSDQIEALLNDPDISYLAEMMNYPGVIFGDEEVHRKIAHAHRIGKPVDGHAPGVRGEELKKYVSAGITTDHECFTAEEALEKLSLGMKILIREGSAAKNFDALEPLIREHWQNIMFCSDDKHPDDLMLGHINELCARAVAKGHDLFHVLQMACLNPIDHYKMRLGRLQAGDAADFIVVEDLKQFKVLRAFIDGKCVVDAGKSAIPSVEFPTPNQFETGMKAIFDFKVQSSGQKLRVIEAIEGQLITREFHVNTTPGVDLQSDISGDILKLAVVNRYSDAPVAIAFIKNFGLKSGAIASSVAHDSHNIIAVGSTDEALCAAVNAVISQKGGICTWSPGLTELLPLPVAGIMSDADCETTAAAYERCDALAKTLGCTLKAPFMTLSFMALLVIPDLKLSDKGLFSGNSFAFTPLSF